jgi:nucleoid-associated protein YgaU
MIGFRAMMQLRSLSVLVGVGVLAAGVILFAAWRLVTEPAPAPVGARAPQTSQQAAPQPPQQAAPQAAPQVSQQPAPQAPQQAAPQASQQASAPVAEPLSPKPSFDVVRVAPGGETVVAGRAAPNAQVALMAQGRALGEARADADGQFVILPPAPLAPGEHVLSLRAQAGGRAALSEQTVTMFVPERAAGGPAGETLATLDAPGQPVRVLSGQGTSPAAAGEERPALRIVAVEAQAGGGAFLAGEAPPGALVRLYLNDAFAAAVTAAPDGKWSVRVDRGMAAGSYTVRADRIGPDGRPLSRVEASFEAPVALASQPPAQARAPAGEGEASPASAAVVREMRTARVERGDSLWRISRSIYGEGMRYSQIYDANSAQIRNPNLIFPGQVLVVPQQD